MTPAATGTVAVEPALLDEQAAGEFLSRSPAWMRQQRQADLAAAARDEEPAGPTWIVIGKSVFYRPEDLRSWVASRAVPRGKVAFDRRRREPEVQR